jgi:hypothetical protein
MQFNRAFLDELFLSRDREIYIKIELLTWEESKIKEIQGLVRSGSLNVDGNSIIRRTISLQLVLDTNTYFLPEVAEEISISKKIKISIGLSNNTYYGRFPDQVSSEFKYLAEPIIYFNLGTFVPTQIGLSHTTDDSSISVEAQDIMVLLNGDIAGELGYDTNFVSSLTNQAVAYRDIIIDSVSYFGGIDRSKVIVLDVPYYADTLTEVVNSNITLYTLNNRSFDFNSATPYASGSPSVTTVTLNSGSIISLQVPLSPQLLGSDSQISVSANNKVTDILEQIKGVLPGQYEYFFNIDGNFIFQLKRNLTGNISEIGVLQDENNAKYSSRFDGIPYIYDFSDKEIISSYSNTPNWRGIKNDFFVYGKDILYHVAIDSIPVVPSTFYGFTRITRTGTGTIGSYTLTVDSSADIVVGSYVSTAVDTDLEYNTRVSYIDGTTITLDFPLKANFSTTTVYFDKWNPNSEVNYNQPWQQYIIDVTEFNEQENPGAIENHYYPELKRFFQYNSKDNLGIYKKITATTVYWIYYSTSSGSGAFNASFPNGNPNTWKYFFDIIDDSTSVGKFSVNSIGRRVKSYKSDSIQVLYPSTVDFSQKIIIFEDKTATETISQFQAKNEQAIELEYQLSAIGTSYISVLKSQVPNLDDTNFQFKDDAFSYIKNLLYTHTNYNETVSINSVPLYFLEPNNRINLSDSNTQIQGDHYLQSFSIPLSHDGIMSMNAIKITPQI